LAQAILAQSLWSKQFRFKPPWFPLFCANSAHLPPAHTATVLMALPMKATKAMKAMKVMKAVKVNKAKRVTKVARCRFPQALVLRGRKKKTTAGLPCSEAMRNERPEVKAKVSAVDGCAEVVTVAAGGGPESDTWAAFREAAVAPRQPSQPRPRNGVTAARVRGDSTSKSRGSAARRSLRDAIGTRSEGRAKVVPRHKSKAATAVSAPILVKRCSGVKAAKAARAAQTATAAKVAKAAKAATSSARHGATSALRRGAARRYADGSQGRHGCARTTGSGTRRNKRGQQGRPPLTLGMAHGKRARAQVLAGLKHRTVGRLTKDKLRYNKKGLIVSIKASQAALKRSGNLMHRWGQVVSVARRELGLVGFVPVGGTSKDGQALYRRAKALHEAAKPGDKSWQVLVQKL